MATWLNRLLLALLFGFSSQVLLWTDVQTAPPEEWLLRGAACLLLAILALDCAARFRIKDLYDSMALIGIIAILGGLLLHPAAALEDFPRTFITRTLGAQAFLLLEMWGLWLFLLRPGSTSDRRRYIGVVICLAFYWGWWLRWSPTFTTLPSTPPTLTSALGSGGLWLALVLVCIAAQRRWAASLSAEALLIVPPRRDKRNTIAAYLLLLAGFMVLALIRAAQNHYSGLEWAVGGLLMLVSWGVLYIRRSPKGATILAARLPMQAPAWVWLIGGGFALLLLTAYAYTMPFVGTESLNAFRLIELGFALVGFGWYPTLAAIVAISLVDRQFRSTQPL